jgi:alpha-mannosidase
VKRSSSPRRKVHLVCNAHIDPVWLWEWPEGAGEALSTFRTAAGFCEDRPGFIFSHNEALLYEWIEEYEPALFRRIRTLVRRGRWAVLGGWFVQPDCNMPSGESFVRQILAGKLYFKKTFGEDVRTAANLDPFGHTRGLVQILAKSGFHSYLFCRPDRGFAALPADGFRWIGYDGSEILAARAEAH